MGHAVLSSHRLKGKKQYRPEVGIVRLQNLAIMGQEPRGLRTDDQHADFIHMSCAYYWLKMITFWQKPLAPC